MKQAQVRKPVLASGAMGFITGSQDEKTAGQGVGKGEAKKTAQKASEQAAKDRVFFAPDGDRRLTINMRQDLHKRIKMAAIEQGSTVGEIIEQLIEQHL